MTQYLVVNRPAGECYLVDSLAEAARIVGSTESDVAWSVKRTGRFDTEHCVVIPSLPEAED